MTGFTEWIKDVLKEKKKRICCRTTDSLLNNPSPGI
jgi:hypothetical protein